MSEVFIDTSAIYAALVREDSAHQAAREAFERLQRDGVRLVSSSFVAHETIALLQVRVGVAAVRTFHQNVLPLLEVVWVDEALYGTSMTALLAAARSRISLTDWSSFEIMRSRGISKALAFDDDFRSQGFELVNSTTSST